jgi:hypothetical protein
MVTPDAPLAASHPSNCLNRRPHGVDRHTAARLLAGRSAWIPSRASRLAFCQSTQFLAPASPAHACSAGGSASGEAGERARTGFRRGSDSQRRLAALDLRCFPRHGAVWRRGGGDP